VQGLCLREPGGFLSDEQRGCGVRATRRTQIRGKHATVTFQDVTRQLIDTA